MVRSFIITKKAVLGVALSFLIGCGQSGNPSSEARQLAQAHCGSCHQFPEPALLDKATWQNNVLPVMGLYLGFLDIREEAKDNIKQLMLTVDYPKKPLISRSDWEKIKVYYQQEAPERLPIQAPADTLSHTNLFEICPVNIPVSGPPSVTCIKIDPVGHQLFAADANAQSLYRIDMAGKVKTVQQQPAITSLASSQKKHWLVTHMGFSINPLESRQGFVTHLPGADSLSANTPDAVILGQLHRPTQTLAADLTGDGQEELLTCQFGFRTGRLSYWTLQADHTYQEHLLREEPGALQAVIRDFNGDGRNDVLAMFAQGDEKIVLFENQGAGAFREKVWLSFPPAYGSTYFEVQDFNQDGLPDLLYTCGDNADYSMILKPYHGVYIFLNQGNENFKQAYFYPMHGAYRALARDYDLDGDLDIAAIAFFADYEHEPEKGFVYLENKGKLLFTAATLPIEKQGRWITMDADDLDGDGDADLALGSYTRPPQFIRSLDTWKDHNGVLLLKNQTH